MSVGVLFVCLGNICRSPTAEAVFRRQVADAGLAGRVRIDSAGTGAWHVGKAPDVRAQAAARQRGYDLSALRARQVHAGDFNDFDYLLAMDRDNLAVLQRMAPAGARARLALTLDFAPTAALSEVPDPYYGGPEGFAQVLDLLEAAGTGLLEELRGRLT